MFKRPFLVKSNCPDGTFVMDLRKPCPVPIQCRLWELHEANLPMCLYVSETVGPQGRIYRVGFDNRIYALWFLRDVESYMWPTERVERLSEEQVKNLNANYQRYRAFAVANEYIYIESIFLEELVLVFPEGRYCLHCIPKPSWLYDVEAPVNAAENEIMSL